MGITLKEVAELANVSRGTVDKVLHNRPGVNKETEKKVREILERYEYEPSQAGKLLASHKKEITIGVISVLSQKEDYFHTIRQGIDLAYNELKQFSFYIKHAVIEVNLENTISKAISDLVRENVNVIVLPPYNSPKVKELMDSIVDKGIQIVTYSTDIPDTKRLFFVGNDYFRSGVTAASLMGKLLNQKGDIIICNGNTGIKCHDDRKEGFLHCLAAEYPDIHIVDQIDDFDSMLDIYFTTKKVMSQYTNINGIFIVSRGVEGIITAVKELVFQARPKIVTFDIYKDTLEHLKSGHIDFVVDQDPLQQGRLIVNTLFDYMVLGKPITNDNINTPMDIYIKENI